MRRTAGVWSAAAPAGPPALLNDIVALSPDEAWAVGQTQDHPVIQHWDGTGWTVVASPRSASLVGAGLLGVAAISPSSAIAVGGGYDRLAGREVPLIQRWDGTNWTAQDLGLPLSTGQVLTSVAMFPVGSAGQGGRAGASGSARAAGGSGQGAGERAWAVGHGVPEGPTALRWDGTDWAFIPVPAPGRARLLAVAGTTPDDVWAVGGADSGPLTMRFDGDSWRRVRCPSGRRPLTDVVALPDGSAWAAGGGGLLHWNGRRWRRVDTGLSSVNTVAALSPTDVWAAGGRGELAHFDGSKWQPAGSSPPLDGSAVWLGAASAAPDTVWLVGAQHTGRPGGAFTLRSVIALTQED
jgi:hypothetical protein